MYCRYQLAKDMQQKHELDAAVKQKLLVEGTAQDVSFKTEV